MGYIIAHKYTLGEIPFEEDFKNELSPSDLEQEIYLIHDCVVEEQYRLLGIHKQFHKLVVKDALKFGLYQIWGISLTDQWRRKDRKYRFQKICKAKWHEEDSFVVKRDLQLELDAVQTNSSTNVPSNNNCSTLKTLSSDLLNSSTVHEESKENPPKK